MKMNLQKLLASAIAALGLATFSLSAAEAIKLSARSGSKIRIEGTSSIHDWQTQASLIGGVLEVGPNFPIEPGQNVVPGKVDCKGQIYVPVNAFKSVKKDGSPYNDRMDEVMYTHLKSSTNPRILFFVDSLVLKEAPKSKDAPYVFESTGQIVVAGVTNKISLPVNVTPLGSEKENRIKIAGSADLKMSDFNIPTPSPNIPGGSLIKTADAVKVIFEWMVAPSKPAAAAAK